MLPHHRKGARRIADIPADTLQQLNHGQLASANLIEFLAVDQRQLLRVMLTECGHDLPASVDLQLAQDWPTLKPMQRPAYIARLLHALDGDGRLFAHCAAHGSDSVRNWAALMVAARTQELTGQLEAIRPFAADPHFGVREMAWLAVRPAICAAPLSAVTLLVPWSQATDPFLRRFASEATRPCGVWCPHITALRRDPTPARPLLQPLHNDPSRYVQDSVANWLNDAARDHPDWVRQLCAGWLQQSDTPATRYLVRRALRRLD